MKEKKPLGYVELENGAKEIFALNDRFLNYTFYMKENWETFRSMLNIFLDEYLRSYPKSIITRVEGKIHLQTQYRYYINTGNETRNQDFRLNELEKDILKFIEFQNRANPDIPIPFRAMEYFVLGIRQANGKVTQQIWLLASDDDTILQGETFVNYIFKDEATNKIYPHSSSIMFISLTRLSKQKSTAGELASFLLGLQPEPETEEVKQIADTFNTSFSTFKNDKEVKKSMSFEERWHNEGKAEGISIGVAKIIELIKSGLSPDEAAKRIYEEQAAPTNA